RAWWQLPRGPLAAAWRGALVRRAERAQPGRRLPLCALGRLVSRVQRLQTSSVGSRIQKDQTTPAEGMLRMPITLATSFVFVRPHYPENVGALARAMKVMGLTRLALVKPSRIAAPSHEMAQRMAV